jgi:hypothetical protein
MKRLALLLVIFLSGCTSPLTTFERSIIYQGRPDPTPATQEDIFFNSDDGTKLHGRYLKHPILVASSSTVMATPVRLPVGQKPRASCKQNTSVPSSSSITEATAKAEACPRNRAYFVMQEPPAAG